MDKVVAQRIVEASDVLGGELELRLSYVGRGMGEATAAIAGSISSLIAAVARAAGTLDVPLPEDNHEVDLDTFVEAVGNFNYDSMGRETIAY